jgi:hypothetical protein
MIDIKSQIQKDQINQAAEIIPPTKSRSQCIIFKLHKAKGKKSLKNKRE